MFKKVTMNLTERDIEITEELSKKLNSRSKASTVSSALAITYELTRLLGDGSALLRRNRDGSMERIVITGLKDA